MDSTGSSKTQYAGGGAFFTDSGDENLYLMAGYPDDSTNGINTLNTYGMRNDSWSVVSPGKEALNKLNRYQAMFATTESSGLGLNFIAGGMDWIPGMVTFNASDPLDLSWSNSTKDVPYFWGPSTEYVRFGNKGVLVSVGGYISVNNSVQRDMSLIQVYDIDSDQWFEVTATGDIPRTRSSFCSGLSAAYDDSSFQMTIYGGYNGKFGGGQGVGVIGDVYVLTMPAFRWIQVSNQTDSTTNGINSRRHLCHTYQERQMIVLGGDFTDASQNTIGGCNLEYPPIKLLDTSTFTWQTQYPLVNATYEVPQLVYNVIGGGPHGKATLQAPPGGFRATIGNTAASAIFSKRVPRTKEIVTEDWADWQKSLKNSTTNSTTISHEKMPSHNTTHTAAIVGGVIGGVSLILGLSGAFILFRRRRVARTQAETETAGGEWNWQKAELPDGPSSPGWAEERPGGYRTHEMFGDDPDALKPRELLGDISGLIPYELRVASPQEMRVPTPQELKIQNPRESRDSSSTGSRYSNPYESSDSTLRGSRDSTPNATRDSTPHLGSESDDTTDKISFSLDKELPALPVELSADVDDR